LGCDAILAVAGVVNEEVSYETAYTRAVSAFKTLAPYAESKKIYVGVENVWSKFLLSPLEMAAFINEINSDYIKVYFDAGNVLVSGYPQHWINVLGGDIIRVHIKDFDTDIGNIQGFKPLLQGNMPWKKVMDALKQAGYNGYLTAEIEPYKTNPEQLAADTYDAMNYIFDL
jgi:hexulose-6-phosphate isomerase